MRAVIAVFKLLAHGIVSLLLILIQGTILFFARGRPTTLWYPRLYHAQCCWIYGLKVVVEGQIEQGGSVVYIGNHLSYMDIPALGSILKGCFVAKKEIESWPIFGLLGSMGQTLYISRAPVDAAQATKMMSDHLDGPLPLIIFPEGTSTDGRYVFPFKSSSFEMYLNRNIKIQPFTIQILKIDEESPDTQAKRDLYAWHGDMTLEPHLWAFAKSKGGVVKVKFHESLSTTSFNDRKSLCAASYDAVVKGLDLSHLAA